MLRRINSALFQAPLGAQIQVVAEAQGNNGVNDARFEYALQILPRETILGLPGCTFTVADTERLQAQVTFHPTAPGTARYDLFEVENGVKVPLFKSARNSASAPLIAFTIEPVPVEIAALGEPAGVPVRRSAAKRAAGKRVAKARKSAKKTAKKTPRKAAKKTARKVAKKAARKTAGRTPARKAVKKASAKRKTTRKRAK